MKLYRSWSVANDSKQLLGYRQRKIGHLFTIAYGRSVFSIIARILPEGKRPAGTQLGRCTDAKK